MISPFVAEILMSSSRHYKKKLDAHRVYVASLKRKRAGETRGGLSTPASLAQCKRLKIQAELGLGDQVSLDEHLNNWGLASSSAL